MCLSKDRGTTATLVLIEFFTLIVCSLGQLDQLWSCLKKHNLFKLK